MIVNDSNISLIPKEELYESMKQKHKIFVFLELLFKIRIKKYTFILLPIISFFLTILFAYIPKMDPIIYYSYNSTIKFTKTDRNLTLVDYLLDYDYNNLVIIPKNNFSSWIFSEYYQIPTNITINYFNNIEEFQNSEIIQKEYLGFYVSNSNESIIRFKIFGLFFYEKNLYPIVNDIYLNYTHHNVKFNFESTNYPQSKSSFMDFYSIFYCMLITISFLFLFLRNTLQFLEFNEQKVFFLLKMNGLKEFSIYFSFFLLDFINFLIYLFFSIIFFVFNPYKINILLFSIIFLLLFLSTYLMLFFWCLLLESSQYFYLFVYILYQVSSFIPSIYFISSIYGNTYDQYGKYFTILVPSSTSFLFFNNLFYNNIYSRDFNFKNIKIGNITSTFQMIIDLLLSIFLYIFLNLIILFFNERKFGYPIIGWKNIFNLKIWKFYF